MTPSKSQYQQFPNEANIKSPWDLTNPQTCLGCTNLEFPNHRHCSTPKFYCPLKKQIEVLWNDTHRFLISNLYSKALFKTTQQAVKSFRSSPSQRGCQAFIFASNFFILVSFKHDAKKKPFAPSFINARLLGNCQLPKASPFETVFSFFGNFPSSRIERFPIRRLIIWRCNEIVCRRLQVLWADEKKGRGLCFYQKSFRIFRFAVASSWSARQ